MIARRHNVTVEVLSRLNNISDVNRIWTGQVLRIPQGSQPSMPRPPTQALTYRVRAGDTLSEIAQRNNVTVEALTRANGISDPNRIGIGLVLKIPKESQPTQQRPLEKGKQPQSAVTNRQAKTVDKELVPALSPKDRSPGAGATRPIVLGNGRATNKTASYKYASTGGGWGVTRILVASLSVDTLALQTQRTERSAYRESPPDDNLSYGPFQVRIPGWVSYEQFVELACKQIFGLREEDVQDFVIRENVIIASTDTGQKHQITSQDVRQGYVVIYWEAQHYNKVMLSKFGADPEEAQERSEANRAKFGKLGKKEQDDILKRAGQEFERRTGGRKPSTSKTREDRELHNAILDDILREENEATEAAKAAKARLDALPLELKALLLPGSERPKPEQYEQLVRIGEKLKQLTATDLALYKQLPKTLSQNLDLFEQSVEAFVRFRREYQAALEESAQSGGSEKTLEQKLSGTWGKVDYSKVSAQPAGYREAMARQLAWEQTQIRLDHMASHPGETAVEMVKGLNPVSVADAVIRDVKEAASGDKTKMARWAAGIGGVGKISGWLAGVAAITYVALLFVPGVNVVVVAQTALIAGFTAIALSVVESELRIQAAIEARSEDEFRYNVDKASEAQVTAITGFVLMVAGFALKLVGAIRLPGRLQNVSNALRMAQQSLLKVTGAGPALESIRATLRKAILGERAGLPEALAEQILKLRKSMRLLESLSGEEFLQRLARGDASLKELTGITPEQARQFLELQKKPAGSGLGEKLRQDFLRALRETPGEAQARVDRSLANMNEALADLDAAQTPQELAAAIERAQARFDAKALADEASLQQQATLRQRLQEELLKKPPPPREPAPAMEPPPGMSDNLKAVRRSFDASSPEGRAAIEQFDAKFKELGGNSPRMEKIVEGLKATEQQKGKTIQERFTEDWNKANRAVRAPYGEAIGEVPELRVRIEVLKADIEAFARSRPHITGVQSWLTKLTEWGKQLDKRLAGELEAKASDVTGVRSNLDGVQAEFRGMFGETGVVGTGRKVPPRPGEKPIFDVDIMADNGRTWIDVKRVEPFGVESSTWTGKPGTGGGMAKKGLRAMAEDLCEAAKNNPVDGNPPKVVYDFPSGVSAAVAKALKAIGRAKGVQLEVRGPVLPDSKVVPVPGRVQDDYDDAIER